MQLRRRQSLRGSIGRAVAACAVALLAAATSARAGLIETDDPTARIAIGATLAPSVLRADLAEPFSLFMWARRTSWEDGQVRRVLAGGATLTVAFDDVSNGVRLRLAGTPATVDVLVPLRDASPDAKVPVNEWMLLAFVWDPAAGRLTGWGRAETTARVEATAAVPGWTGGAAWPITVGADDADTGSLRSFTGQLGLVVVRADTIDATDFDDVWNDGAPRYFSPALADTGALTGFAGVEWMIGHGVVTNPLAGINATAAGAELGGPVTTDNLLVYNERDAGSYFSAGVVAEVGGAWTYRSPHEPGSPWAGFFVRELPTLAVVGSRTVTRVSPAARRLAYDEPQGIVRVVASANSRGARNNGQFYGEALENWAFGGVFQSRRGTTAGVTIPAIYTSFGPWPFFDGTSSEIGTVFRSRDTPFASVSFGNFGSHGQVNVAGFEDYVLAGGAIVIEPGSTYLPKARPEPGTLLDHVTDAMTVRAMLLRFPGAGVVSYTGIKTPLQAATTVTDAGPPTDLALDTTVLIHALGGADVIDPGAQRIVLASDEPAIAVGDACFISAGPGRDGISTIAGVTRSAGTTTITLDRWFPIDPTSGASTLRFGPADPVWVEYAWPGLDPDDPDLFRGLRLAASDGLVVVLFLECLDPTADGFVIGAIGRSGQGYDLQLSNLFTSGGIPIMSALTTDVWLQFFAHQVSTASSMAAYTDRIREGSPDTEVWWCGDPDLDTTVNDIEGTDGWQAYILDEAAVNDVGAIVAHEHPTVGTGNERAADGQTANQSHLSARGNEIYVQAVLDMMRDAALPDPSETCPADLDGDAAIGFTDLIALLAAWGPCAPCAADIDENGNVGLTDLLLLLAAWGPCAT